MTSGLIHDLLFEKHCTIHEEKLYRLSDAVCDGHGDLCIPLCDVCITNQGNLTSSEGLTQKLWLAAIIQRLTPMQSCGTCHAHKILRSILPLGHLMHIIPSSIYFQFSVCNYQRDVYDPITLSFSLSVDPFDLIIVKVVFHSPHHQWRYWNTSFHFHPH